MVKETNAYDTYTSIGKVEDISDIISNVDPFETPFLSKISSVNTHNILHQWQTDALDTPSSTNAVLEGDAYTPDVLTATTMLSNTCQISTKSPRVTGSQLAVKSYGRGDELDYQVMKKGKALKTDIERTVLSNNAEVTGNATTARQLGAIESWYTSNVSRGAGGSSGGLGNTAATDGTQRAFTETLLKTVLQAIWTNGGNVDLCLLGGTAKQTFSTFTGNATRFDKAEDGKLNASVDVYVGDFGTFDVLPSRHCRARSVHLLQTDMWAMVYLRPMQTIEIATTGDSRSKLLLAEYTLESRNQKASGIIADLL